MLRFLIVLSLLIPSFGYAYECNEEIDMLARKYETKITCNIQENQFGDRVTYKRADQNLINQFSSSLNNFFKLYNKEIIKNHIDKMILVGELRFNGSIVGGLSNGNIIFISIDDYRSSAYRESIYSFVLNHEFSSNILRGASYYKRISWRSISMLYDESYDFLMKNVNNFYFSRQTSENLLRDGLLVNYSATNHENDFNLYAEKLFTRDSEFLRYKNRYPKVAKKLEMLKQIYREAGYTGKFPDET